MTVREYRIQQIAQDEAMLRLLKELRSDLEARTMKIEQRLAREKLLLAATEQL